MKVLESAALLVIGTVLMTFTGMSFALFPRQISLSNPSLLVELLAVAGLVFCVMGARGLYRIHGIVARQSAPASRKTAAA